MDNLKGVLRRHLRWAEFKIKSPWGNLHCPTVSYQWGTSTSRQRITTPLWLAWITTPKMKILLRQITMILRPLSVKFPARKRVGKATEHLTTLGFTISNAPSCISSNILISYYSTWFSDGEQSKDTPQIHFSRLPLPQLGKPEYSWWYEPYIYGVWNLQCW